MRKRFLNILAIFCIAAFAKAQTISPSILASAGGSDKTSTISLDWTMGEYAVETIFSADNMYTQGFNQPYLIITSSGSVAANDGVYKISIAPNPVLSVLNFSIASLHNIQVFVSVADIAGRIFIQKIARSSFGNMQIDFKGLPAGTYNLIVREAGSLQIIKTYQVIKI